MKDHDKTLNAFETVAFEVATGDAESLSITTGLAREAHALLAHAQRRIAEARRQELPGVVMGPRPRGSRFTITRENCIIEASRAVHSQRDFDAISGEDLRVMLEAPRDVFE